MSRADAFLVLFAAILMSRFAEHIAMLTARAWAMRRLLKTPPPEIVGGVWSAAELAQSRSRARHEMDECAYMDGWRACESCNRLPPSGGDADASPDNPANDHIMHHYQWDGSSRGCKGKPGGPPVPPPPPIRAPG